ncbi:hypothetical protein L1049_010270 [Liquidambar formosana]|uniref:GDSL esterase/lipase n=1 Tax=Liquidambar formosana TaxID=63359 RepID=A0AAP0NAS1_LIQFO
MKKADLLYGVSFASAGSGYDDLTANLSVMNSLGATRLVVVGVPPLGCMPLVKTIMGENKCVGTYNKVAFSFSSKIKGKLATLKASLRMKTAFVDAYGVMESAINRPQRYGIVETSKGCCGTGTIEYGDTCRGLRTCNDPTKYVFWDAVHPTEKMYKILAEEALKSLIGNV